MTLTLWAEYHRGHAVPVRKTWILVYVFMACVLIGAAIGAWRQ